MHTLLIPPTATKIPNQINGRAITLKALCNPMKIATKTGARATRAVTSPNPTANLALFVSAFPQLLITNALRLSWSMSCTVSRARLKIDGCGDATESRRSALRTDAGRLSSSGESGDRKVDIPERNASRN